MKDHHDWYPGDDFVDVVMCEHYIAMLYWHDDNATANANSVVSFLELVIDYEVYSGVKLNDRHAANTTWFRKAQIFRIMWRRLFVMSKELRAQRDEFPETVGRSLSAFGIKNKLSGLARRPRLLMGQHTERLIALNVAEQNSRYNAYVVSLSSDLPI